MKTFAPGRRSPVGPRAAAGMLRGPRRMTDVTRLRRILRSRFPAGAPTSGRAPRADAASASYVSGLSGGGHALPAAVRAYMEPRFGVDFRAVRVHTGRDAAGSARALNARAYTLANHVVFDAGQYAPETAAGRRLIAHELAHVVQQRQAVPANRVMRSPYPGCDRTTTGVADADARIDQARRDALGALRRARAAFPKMSTNTLRLLNRHFHCPSSTDIRAIIGMLARIETALPALKPNCAGSRASVCHGGVSGRIWHTLKRIEFCPPAFVSDPKKAYRFAGLFVNGAAQVAGATRACSMFDACYDDFTVPASTMASNSSSYAAFAVELAGHALPQPATVPCDPIDTGVFVAVPPGAINDPMLIRPVTGYDVIPQGSNILSIYKDDAGNRFIYHDGLPGARQYLSGEPKRYYLP